MSRDDDGSALARTYVADTQNAIGFETAMDYNPIGYFFVCAVSPAHNAPFLSIGFIDSIHDGRICFFIPLEPY